MRESVRAVRIQEIGAVIIQTLADTSCGQEDTLLLSSVDWGHQGCRVRGKRCEKEME